MSLPFERVGAIEREIGIITAASYSKDLSARFSYNLVKISYGKNHNFRGNHKLGSLGVVRNIRLGRVVIQYFVDVP